MGGVKQATVSFLKSALFMLIVLHQFLKNFDKYIDMDIPAILGIFLCYLVRTPKTEHVSILFIPYAFVLIFHKYFILNLLFTNDLVPDEEAFKTKLTHFFLILLPIYLIPVRYWKRIFAINFIRNKLLMFSNFAIIETVVWISTQHQGNPIVIYTHLALQGILSSVLNSVDDFIRVKQQTAQAHFREALNTGTLFAASGFVLSLSKRNFSFIEGLNDKFEGFIQNTTGYNLTETKFNALFHDKVLLPQFILYFFLTIHALIFYANIRIKETPSGKQSSVKQSIQPSTNSQTNQDTQKKND